MTETDNKTRYGRIAVILIALAIVIAAFVSFIAMNNERIYEQNTKYLQGSTEQSARRISEWMTDSQTEIKLLSSMYESTLASVDEISAAGIEQLANYTKFDYTTISLSDGLTIDDKGQEADASDREYFARGMEGESGVCAVENSLFYNDLSVIFYTPLYFKDEADRAALAGLRPDALVVAAYGLILPQSVLDIPTIGPFNVHGSLLPQYRGAAPINWAVINGDTETGVTTFFLTDEIDTGKIIRQKHLPIADTDDVGTVHDSLMAMGAGLVLETVDLLLEGKTDAIPQEEFYQDSAELRPAPKIFKETCRIDWNQPLKKIRGLSPYPAAWTEIISPEGVPTALKVYQAEKHPATHNLPVGTICTDKKSYVDIAVEGGYLRLLSLQLAGKKRLSITEFLNGFKQIGEYTVK